MEGRKFLVFALLLPQILTLQFEYEDDDDMFRLPTTLVPQEYSLSLLTNTDQETFSGTVNITFNLAEEETTVEYIYLHADTNYVTITYAELNDEINCTVEGLNYNLVKLFCENITEINNVLYIEFDGVYSQSDENGLVKAFYNEGRYSRHFFIESRFEPTFARRAFPCFDEPDFTANFSIEIIHLKDYNAISNTARESIEDEDDNYSITTFETTAKIPTYLVTILVSQFTEVVAVEGDYSFTFLARPNIYESMTFVTNYYGQIMEALTNFTGQSLQDTGDTESYQVVIPDYYSDNMGNFGLFAYRERDLMDDGEKTAVKVTQNILQNIAYKLTHQWFGGEITAKWWSDVWANEAVPAYLKYVIPDKVQEEYEYMNQFVVEVVQKSMQYDAMPFVRALSSDQSDVENEWEIEHKLDKYSLLKGATVLHMINFMLRGEGLFKENLQNHLMNRSDTDGQNMLQDLTKSDSIQDLYGASYDWAFTAGFPLLSVSINETRLDTELLKMSQKRFVYPTDNTSTISDLKWSIPISYTTATKKNFGPLINVYYTPNVEVFITINKDDWAIFNLQGRQHYRVNYEEELWRRIINALKDDTERSQIHPLNRAQLIDDIFNVARIGEVEYSLAFELADFLVNETDYYPWYSAFNAFSYLLGKMADDEAEENLKMYILNLMDNIIHIPDLDSSTNENETHIDLLKKVMVLEWACKLGHSGCINFAQEQFLNYKQNQSSIEDYNFRPVILCNGIRYSENVTVDWRFLWSVYTSSSSVHEQYDILQALGCTEDDDVLSMYVIRIVVPPFSSEIKRQDSLVVFESVLGTAAGVVSNLELLQGSNAYMKFIFNGAADEEYVMSDLILSVAEKVVTEEQRDLLNMVVNDDSLNNFQDLRTRAIALADVNKYWAEQYQDVIKEILYEKFPTTESPTTTEATSETSTTEPTEPTTEPETTAETTTSEPSTTPGSGETIFSSNVITMSCAALLIIYNVFS